MQKLKIFILLILVSLLSPMLTLRADFGPKSTLQIDVIGVDKPYALELLFEGELPDDVFRDDAYQNMIEYRQELPEMIKDFSEDGFISSALYRGRPTYQQRFGDHTYRYTYVPPRTFKLLIIFDDEMYLTSPIITTRLFDSKVTWDLTEVDQVFTQSGVGSIHEELPLTRFSFDLFLRIIITIGVEVLILFLFRYRTRFSLNLILAVNAITQITLTGFMFSMRYFFSPFFGEIFVLIVGEALIFLLEGIIYVKFLKERTKKHAILYTLSANFASLLLGFILMIIFWIR